jgi:hypothetical protein
MTERDLFSELKHLCERAPSRSAFKSVVTHATAMWDTPSEDAHSRSLEYLRARLDAWYVACPVEHDPDYWAEPAVLDDPFVLTWSEIWPGLCSGTEQVQRDDAEDPDEWPAPICADPEHHSWMQLVRSLHIDADDFGGLDFHLFGQARNLRPERLNIDLPNPDTAFDRDAFFNFPNFARLRSLCISSFRFSPDNLRALIMPLSALLEHLSMASSDQGDDIAAALVDNADITGLSVLDLSDSGLGDRGCERLAAGAFSGSLQELYAANNRIGDEGLAALARAPWLATTKKLILHGNQIGDAGARALAQSPHIGRLEVLSLFNNPLTVDGVDALLASPRLPSRLIESLQALRERLVS